ncbi:hypothetical protein [Streptomyces sp. NPDC002088]|uniref:hypothetical protein n=1 Tax=Streptomyces sp. NPDC002088 TaxID=3154665 RepID=UPI00332416E0
MNWDRVRDEDKVRRSKEVPVLDTFGELARCWCGEPSNHDWPGREDGAPHPKEEGEQ